MKNILIVLFCTVAAASCNNRVSSELYEDLQKEYGQLKQEQQRTQADLAHKDVMLERALMELTSISGVVNNLKYNAETGRTQYKMQQAEQLTSQLNEVKKKIRNLEKIGGPQIQKTIRALNGMIKQQEKEITQLKSLINRQRDTIRTQKSDIQQKERKIGQQKADIQRKDRVIGNQERQLKEMYRRQEILIEQMGEMWYQAARDIEKMADNAPDDISRKSNVKKVNNWRRVMYRSSVTYFKNAKECGYGSVDADVRRVEQKLRRL